MLKIKHNSVYQLLGLTLLSFSTLLLTIGTANGQLQGTEMLNEAPDLSADYWDFRNTHYLADELVTFDPTTGTGTVKYLRHNLQTGQAFNNMLSLLTPADANEFPSTEYAASPELPFTLSFYSANTVRIQLSSGPQLRPDETSLMLAEGYISEDKKDWTYKKTDKGHTYSSTEGTIVISEKPWHIYVYDAYGKLLTSTVHKSDVSNTFTPNLPFGYIRRAKDYSRSMNAVFSLSPDEKIFGCGESFTNFNKRGTKVTLWTDDANGVQNETMYKPVPFFLSSRGYGMFMHHSSPITVDFGKYYSPVNSMMIGDDELDLFIFLGEPKQVLDAYTNVTGKAPMPPLWSFGFWMSRITYFSEADGKEVAKKLRKNKIPSDVIHFDTGWFGVDWRNDYKFPSDRFPDPEKMINDFQKDGFRISLWQLPYFTPKNALYDELVAGGFYIKDKKGNIPVEDAMPDFTNPDAVAWYQKKIKGLMDLGVGVIKVDFGEAAPADGIYSNGKTGFYEHNMYPLRYNKTVADITKEVTGYPFIWARSTWAGSQRYPVHWGGDPATTNSAMAATLRGGLSIGLSGFSFWSHDIGGFVTATPEDVYRRWTPFGMLTGHVRSHGNPPTEPWEYGEDFMNSFRKADNMRYRLMPYIYAQAKHASENGLPMVRALFIEYPQDPGSWLIDNQYLFGEDMLIAPLFENATSRNVYLPPGTWIDYQTKKTYTGGWHEIAIGEIPIIALVRAGAIIPHCNLAQSTQAIDWSDLTMHIYGDAATAQGKLYLPGTNAIKIVEANQTEEGYTLTIEDPAENMQITIKKY